MTSTYDLDVAANRAGVATPEVTGAMPTIDISLLGSFAVAVDGEPVPDALWSRRQAAALVKVLALTPTRRLHREQVIDLIWPEDTLDEAGPKLHKAAHFARKAIGVPDAIVLRDDTVQLCPGAELVVDAERFEELAKRSQSDGDERARREALALYGGELLPQDRYEEWAEARRDHLQLRYVELLRADGRWDAVIELDPTDEAAHLALMRAYAAKGDRHAALRQFERLDRALSTELGVSPGRDAVALRDRLLGDTDVVVRPDPGLVGRERELRAIDLALTEAAAGRSRTLYVSGAAGLGKSSLLAAATARATELGFRTAHGTAAPVEGAWAYAPVIEALADLCRRHPSLLDGLSDVHRAEIDRALGGHEAAWEGESTHQRLFVAAAELVRLAAGVTGLLLTIDDLHDADDASLRLLHYVARSTVDQRVCVMLAHRPAPGFATLQETRQSLLGRHRGEELVLSPLDDDEAAEIVGRHVADPSDELLARIGALGGGVPFAVNELARRAADEPQWMQSLDANMVAGIASPTREVLQRVAVVGATFDTDEFVVLSGLEEDAAFEHLDAALAASVVEPASSGYRFRHGLVREALLDDLAPHRRRRIHRDAATRLVELSASPARIGHHLMAAGDVGEAVPYLLSAAQTKASVGAYRDALELVDAVRPHATGDSRHLALSLRGDLLNAIGDPAAPSAFREALDGAPLVDRRRLRAKLARSAVMAGDLETARAALDGLEVDGGADDADILLAQGAFAFFVNDLEMATKAVDGARTLVLAGERNWKVLEMVALEGLVSHLAGDWFDRMRSELRRSKENPEVANTIFDGHLCVAEYMLYGPTPYDEVIAIARDLQATAKRSGALRAAGFASALLGEAALMSGDLELAERELVEARELHRDLGSVAGEAHSLQRLAEVRVAQGRSGEALDLLHQALPLARGSMIGNHLLHRVFGTMIVAAPDPLAARASVDRAESFLGWEDHCSFCGIMLDVPATIACARVGDLEHAHRYLAAAEFGAFMWQGTSWEAGFAEARAAVAAAEGDAQAARDGLAAAAEQFARAGQPLDAERCRLAAAAV